jgi:hypothetical protein
VSSEGWYVQRGTEARQSKSQNSVAKVAMRREIKVLKPTDNLIERISAKYQVVSKENTEMASKVPNSEGRARNREGEDSIAK